MVEERSSDRVGLWDWTELRESNGVLQTFTSHQAIVPVCPNAQFTTVLFSGTRNWLPAERGCVHASRTTNDNSAASMIPKMSSKTNSIGSRVVSLHHLYIRRQISNPMG